MQKKFFRFKNSLLTFIAITTPIVATTTTMSTVARQKEPNNFKPALFSFDGNFFSSFNQVLDYGLDNVDIRTFSGDAKSYLFDGKFFTEYSDLTWYLQKKFLIDQKITYNNPYTYVINGAGELSNKVLNSKNGFRRVYQGKDDVAYLTRKEALETYKVYDKIYVDVEGRRHDNIEDFKTFLKEEKLLEIQNNESEILLYKNGGLMQTEQEVKNWLRKNIKRGFGYDGRIFSDYNYKEFLRYFDETKIKNLAKTNIKKINDADKRTYWLDLERSSLNNAGTFAGPQYIETVAKIPTKIENGFEEISSTSAGGYIQGVIAVSLLNSIKVANYESNVDRFSWRFGLSSNDSDSKIINEPIFNQFLWYLKREKIITDGLYRKLEESLFSNLKDDNEILIKGIIAKSVMGLDEISNASFTDIHKLFVAMKRILNATKVYAELEKYIFKFEKVFKDLAFEVLTYDLTKIDNNREDKVYDVFNLIDNLELFSFYELSNFMLNPNSFYKDAQKYKQMMNILETVKNVTNQIGSIIGGTNGVIDAYEEYKDYIDPKKTKNIKGDNASLAKQKGKEAFEEGMTKDIEDVGKLVGLTKKSIKKAKTGLAHSLSSGFKLFTKVLGAAFEINQLFDFIVFKTFEYKIDDYQSIYYHVETFKVPISGYVHPVEQPKLDVIPLTDSILDMMLPRKKDGGTDSADVYEFQGKYYLDPDNAQEDLKNAIYLNPEFFLPTTEVLVSNLEFDNSYEFPEVIPKITRSKNEDDGGISAQEYYRRLNKNIDDYVNDLFEVHYNNSEPVEWFTDGMGGHFSSKEEAIMSMRTKIDDDIELESWSQYIYKSRNNFEFLSNNLTDLDFFVNENEIIYSKNVKSDSLIKTANYSELKEFNQEYFKIYELNYYGDKKYFSSQKDAWNYLLINLNNLGLIREKDYTLYSEEYIFKNHSFEDKTLFMKWIEDNVEVIK